MTDSYGNYFCQTIVRSVGSEQRLRIIKALKPSFFDVSCDRVGTLSMQRLLENVCDEQEKQEVFECVYDKCQFLAQHQNGNYTLLAILSIPNQRQENLYVMIKELLPYFFEMTQEQNGVCIINKMIQISSDQDQIIEMVLILSDRIFEIIQDQYGNYAVTTALEVK